MTPLNFPKKAHYWESHESAVATLIFSSLAVAATAEHMLSGVGMGFMYGWRAPKKSVGNPPGISVGFGFALDNGVKRLADGFTEGA
jgi:hypothetical protein